nr:unnamed protein product [Callosobruchus chinensis]
MIQSCISKVNSSLLNLKLNSWVLYLTPN